MFSIDKFRSAARHSAWKQDKNNYNPFSRIPSRPQQTQSDIEQGILPDTNSTHSQNCADELKGDDINGPSDSKPKRNQTEPVESVPTSASSRHPPISALSNSKRMDSEKIDTAEPLPNGDADDTLRQRKSRPGIKEAISFRAFGKRRKNDELEKTESEDESKKKLRKKIPISTQLRAVLYPQWLTINWLLLLVPVGIAVAQVKSIPGIAVFVINFMAIIPLAGILSYATEEIALRVGETLGGLLNASFGYVYSDNIIS